MATPAQTLKAPAMREEAQHSDAVRPPALWLLVALSAVGPLALNIFQPSIGAIAADFSISSAHVQWALTIYSVGLTVGQVIFGPLSDRYGRKPLLYIGLGGFLLANMWLALAPSFSSVLLGRFLQGLSGCCGMVLTRAIVRDCYPTERTASAYGYITTAMVAVPALAPSLGFYLETLGSWRHSFWFLVFFGSLVLLVCWRLVPETNKNPLTSLNLTSYVEATRLLGRNRIFMAYCGVIGFGTASFFAFLTGAPFATIERLGGTGKDFSLYFLILSAGYMAGNFIAGRYATTLGLPLMTKLGHAIGLIGATSFLWNLYQPSMETIFIPAAIIALGGGLFNPASMAGALSVRPEIAGTASSVVGVLSMLVAIVLSAIVNTTLSPDLIGFVCVYVGCSYGAALCSAVALSARSEPAGKP
ncbi:MAG: multidrug effflux MFS transporter [Pseudomonadota bacterium]